MFIIPHFHRKSPAKNAGMPASCGESTYSRPGISQQPIGTSRMVIPPVQLRIFVSNAFEEKSCENHVVSVENS
jgi:hypothetical protein